MTTSNALSKDATERIRREAFRLGFDHMAVTRPHIPQRYSQEFLSWCEAGLAGGMAYLTSNPEKRVQLERTYPGVKTIITLGVSYFQGPFPEKPGKGYGRIARYAWGMDYHEIIQSRLQVLIEKIKNILGTDFPCMTAVDTKPLLERALASSAGLGFIGKNTVLIVPRVNTPVGSFHVGSWVFLTEILLNIPLAHNVIEEKIQNGCGSCEKCLTACPTEAFEKPYRLKADRCIAYLTIENKGWISRPMREKMGDWLFGCDVCQEVCPFNARAIETRWPEFHSSKGVGPWVSLQDILSVSDEAGFKKRYEGTPLTRPKRKGLIRNACVVAANAGDETLVPSLKKLLNDGEVLIRGHALWALSKLEDQAEVKTLAERLLSREEDRNMREECEAILRA